MFAVLALVLCCETCMKLAVFACLCVRVSQPATRDRQTVFYSVLAIVGQSERALHHLLSSHTLPFYQFLIQS